MKKNDKIYIILIIIIFLVLVPLCIYFANKESGNNEENKKHNLSLVKELINYEDIENINTNNKELNNVKSFIIIRNRDDKWILDRAYHGNESYKKWTKEDLLNYDLIVFAISSYDSKQYEDAAGKTSYITSESVTLYYYSIKDNIIFNKEFIKGEELKETEKYNHEISSNDIFDKIKDKYKK